MPRKARISAALVSLMQGGQRHAWTLEEFQEALCEDGWRSDFSSVFRAAEKLAADGTIRRVLLEDGRSRFELVGPHHDHLYCLGCRQLVPMPCLIANADYVALEQATGAAILDHHLVLSGFCRDCRPAPETSAE